MKKSYIFSCIKANNFKWSRLFQFSIILLFSASFLKVKAQCPTATASPSVVTICSGTNTSIELKSDQLKTTYSWTVVQTDVVGANDGMGSTIAHTLTATDAISGSVIYTITPLANGCKGTTATVRISVNPTPVISATPLASTITSGSDASIALTSDAEETAFSWTVIQSGVTGAKAGYGKEIGQTLRATSETGIATYHITPNLKGCAGEPINAKVIVKRQP